MEGSIYSARNVRPSHIVFSSGAQAVDMPSEIDYCPFCGERLAMDESLDDHCADDEECGAAYERWQGSSSGGSILGADRGQRVVGWVIAAVVLLYAVIIQGSILLGLIASVIVLAVAHVDWTGLAG